MDFSILTGNDYFEGVPKIGCKTALKLIKDKKELGVILDFIFKGKSDPLIKRILSIKEQMMNVSSEYELESIE